MNVCLQFSFTMKILHTRHFEVMPLKNTMLPSFSNCICHILQLKAYKRNKRSLLRKQWLKQISYLFYKNVLKEDSKYILTVFGIACQIAQNLLRTKIDHCYTSKKIARTCSQTAKTCQDNRINKVIIPQDTAREN